MTLVERLRNFREAMEAKAEGSRGKKIFFGILVALGGLLLMALGMLVIGVILIASPFLWFFIIFFLIVYGIVMIVWKSKNRE